MSALALLLISLAALLDSCCDPVNDLAAMDFVDLYPDSALVRAAIAEASQARSQSNRSGNKVFDLKFIVTPIQLYEGKPANARPGAKDAPVRIIEETALGCVLSNFAAASTWVRVRIKSGERKGQEFGPAVMLFTTLAARYET